jgi:succinyl-diaminopimelate desuccinylase
MAEFDPIPFARDLIRCASVTPLDAGAMDLLQTTLEGLGFTCRRMRFGEIENLYARRGSSGPNLCYAGHTDVVPPGDLGAWTHEPFAADVVDGVLIGRGAADMKGSIAAFAAAAAASPDFPGSLSLLITGDEEGQALDGTRKVVEVLQAEGERIDHCLVGEPSSVDRLCDVVKVGRRGSINAWITVKGRQGHVAYPERAKNPIPAMITLLDRLQSRRLDEGWPAFPPSNLEITSVDVGNPASNVIPAEAKARLNIRFNPSHTGAELDAWLHAEAQSVAAETGCEVVLDALCSGDAFLTEPGPFIDLVSDAVEAITGARPEANTTGGTSDARFIRALCPVVELGLIGQTIHQVNERVPVAEILKLRDVYAEIIRRYPSMRA